MESHQQQALFDLISQLQKAICPQPVVYTVPEAAKLLKCGERSIRHHLYEAKDLKYLLVGREVRILDADLRDFLEHRRKPCVSDKDILP